MSTDHHDPHAFGAPLTAAEMNAPLGQLDAAIDAVSAGSGASAARQALSDPALQQAAFMYDDFDRANATLNGTLTPSGQTWVLTGGGAATATVTDRKFTSTGNVYACLPYGAAVKRISGSFVMSPGLGTDVRSTSMLTLIMDESAGGLSDMLHLIFSPAGWGLTKYVAGAATVLLSGAHDLISDVPYNVALEISGTTVTVYPPQGVPVSVTDAAIGTTIAPTFGCWQILPSANALIGKWLRVSMGPQQQGRTAAAIGAAPSAEVGWLRGSGLTRRQRFTYNLTGAGWYRVATEYGYLAPTIVGLVKIEAIDPYRALAAHVTAKGDCFGTPLLAAILAYKYQGAPVTQMRLSTNSGSPYQVALDIYIANADPVTVTMEFEGYFTVISAPVVGATALATLTSTLAL